MQRITITVDDDLAQEIDRIAQARGYQNRSETMRDLVRAGMAQTQAEAPVASDCVASVIYVYDQERRELPKRLARAYRDAHDLSVATLRVALDHDTCLEVAVLKGASAEVRQFAERIVAERGVRHGQLVVIPADIESERHTHGHRRAHAHEHIRVR
jgi:CopG family nickel-responsive transcriptional regulator